MELRNFIETTLTDIAEAVYEAREKTRGKIAIAPGSLNGNSLNEISYIDFDLAVTANEISKTDSNSKIKTEVGINVLGNKIGAGVAGGKVDLTKLETEKISRISFKIPLSYSAIFDKK